MRRHDQPAAEASLGTTGAPKGEERDRHRDVPIELFLDRCC
jgi:hypothetical protein